MIRFFLIFFFLFSPLFAATEIIVWHAFEGFHYEKFAEIVEDFNHHSGAYQVKLALDALDQAVAEGNVLLEKFEKENS